MRFVNRLLRRETKQKPALNADEYSTREERRDARTSEWQRNVEESFASQKTECPADAKRATVRGKNYVYWVPRIEELKRLGRLEEALDLTLECCRAAERDRGKREPAPAYTRHAAIICRKLGYLVDEQRELQRWLSFGFTSKNRQFEERLLKVTGLIEKRVAEGRSIAELSRPPQIIQGSFGD